MSTQKKKNLEFSNSTEPITPFGRFSASFIDSLLRVMVLVNI